MNKLKELRTSYGLKQKDIAERLGTTQQTIARWETGHTAIPAGQLKDLALLFGCSVDKLLGVERDISERPRPQFAEVNHELPFGTAKLVFAFGEREYPIDERARESLERTKEFIGLPATEGWLEFATMNNRLVFANPDYLQQFELITDDHEEMPDWYHPEVYHALESREFGDTELGPKIEDQVNALAKELGEDGVSKLVDMTEVVFRDGSSKHLFLDEDGASGVFEIATHRAVGNNAFAILSSDGPDMKTFVNLSQVALLEVPLERYLREIRTE